MRKLYLAAIVLTILSVVNHKAGSKNTGDLDALTLVVDCMAILALL